MSIEHSPNNSSSKPPDDAFWAALFSQEDAIEQDVQFEEAEITYATYLEKSNSQTDCENDETIAPDPWQHALDVFQTDQTVELTVTGFNKGGLLVNWYGLQGFVPASQLINFPQFHKEIERLNALKKWRSQKLKLKIIEVDRAQNRLIFSERAALVKADDRERLLNQIGPGENIRGEVTNLTSFGAFVDLGGVEGLIHISELSWSRVSHPSDIVKPGQRVDVTVLNVDPDNGRVALSLKRLKKDPWKTVDQEYKPGQIIKGNISKIVSFGAFVQIDDELEGLIHISELAEGTFLHPRNVVTRGQEVKAKILHVDGKAKRLALSLRGVSG